MVGIMLALDPTSENVLSHKEMLVCSNLTEQGGCSLSDLKGEDKVAEGQKDLVK